jgi:hypothetical protein
VTAQSGDYSFSQISGSAATGQLPSAGGDLSGTLSNARVQAIQGEPLATTAPISGQALVWNGSSWAPSTVSGGGGSSMTYQLQDLTVTWTSSSVLTIGGNCSPSARCNVRFGNQTFNITSSATATLSGSATGTAYFYVTSAGAITVGHNLTIACSGCNQEPASSFPTNVIPLWSWTATTGAWDSAGGRDQRAFLSTTTLTNGTGIILPGPTTIAVDTGVIPTYLMTSATLTYGSSLANGTCATDQTLTVTGANPGDAVAPGWPALPAGVLGIMFVSSTNNVSVRLCNFSGSTVSAANLTASYRATIVRNY